MGVMVDKANKELETARRNTGLNSFELDQDGRRFNTFHSAPGYVADTQPEQEDPRVLGRELRFHLTHNQLNVSKVLTIYLTITIN